MSSPSTAVLIGATGLVGGALLTQLLDDARFGKVVSLGRRPSGKSSPKLEEHTINFDDLKSWQPLVKGDVAFSALGTTIAQAKTKEAQWKIDHDYQLWFAQAAKQNGVPTYVLCSASSANSSASVFYSRMKGKLDDAVQALGFDHTRIMRPSLLVGDRTREKPRTGEKVGSVMLGIANAVGLFRRYKEIPGATVAKAMLNSSFDPAPGAKIYNLDEVFTEAARG
ncbi:MAG: NAD(P)H-binding protein [Myxococcaceae bacterium]